MAVPTSHRDPPTLRPPPIIPVSTPIVPQTHAPPIIPVTSTDVDNPSPAKKPKKSKPKPNVVYSQPADTGTGQNVMTQLVYAVGHLKNHGHPMRLQELAIFTDTPLLSDHILLEKFKAHDRVVHDPKTDLYSYRNDYTFKSKATLLTEIQRHTRHGGGLSVRTLKDSWRDAPAAIEELERAGDVLVTRTVKDGQMRLVFWNEVRGEEEGGGMGVEKEFQDLWRGLTVPDDTDLLKSLASEGLHATASHTPLPKHVTGPGRKKGKKTAQRHRTSRITNVHLKGEVDLTRDYVPGEG